VLGIAGLLVEGVVSGSPVDKPADAAAAGPPGRSLHPEDLLIGTTQGLEVWGRDGRQKGILSKGEARHPRWLNADTIVVLRHGGHHLADGALVETINVHDGSRRRAAHLPKFQCNEPRETEDFPVDLQEESDFQVDEDEERVCLHLFDRNINMADTGVMVSVALKSGRVRRWLDLGAETCKAPADVVKKEPPPSAACNGRKTTNDETASATPKSSETSRKFPASLQKKGHGLLVLGANGGPFTLRDYDMGEESPSGRWVLLQGEQEDGDYIHSKVVLFDRQTGSVFPFGTESSHWPSPLEVVGSGKHRRVKTPIAKAEPVVGETVLRWLGPASHEVLVVDHSIVVPGQASFAFQGDLIE